MAVTPQDQLNASVQIMQQIQALQQNVLGMYAQFGIAGANVDAVNLNLLQAYNKSQAVAKALLP